MADFSLIEEILKEAVGTLGGGALLVFGGWLTLRATLAENREKIVAERRKVLEEHRLELEKAVWERREALIAETLINAYRDIERASMRVPGLLGHDRRAEFRLAMERAIGEVQLLGDETSARLAFAFVDMVTPKADPAAEAARRALVEAQAGRHPDFDAGSAGVPGYLDQIAQAGVLNDLMVAMRIALRRRLNFEDSGADLPIPLVLRFVDEVPPAAR